MLSVLSKLLNFSLEVVSRQVSKLLVNEAMASPVKKGMFLHCTTDAKLSKFINELPKNQPLSLQSEERRLILEISDKNFECFTNGFKLVSDHRYVFNEGDLLDFDGNTYELQYKDARTSNNKRKTEEVPSAFETLMKRGKKTEESGWESIDNDSLLIYTPSTVKGRRDIAGFDMDGTIIKTKSGNRFPKDKDDWLLHNPKVTQKLRECYDNGFKLVFFTNQAGLTTTQRVAAFKEKIQAILTELDIPIQVFVSLAKTVYRKPLTGMWTTLVREKNDSVEVDVESSLFVGDAAGRKKPDGKPADHSNSDLLFALNLGLRFFTPEEYFMSQQAQPYNMPDFDPRIYSSEDPEILRGKDIIPVGLNLNKNITYPSNVEVIVMVGMPGSGKSHFAQTALVSRGYRHVNRDKLGTWQKCVKAMEEHLKNKLSVVIDNTNGSVSARERYISAAKSMKIPIRCFKMTTTYEHCKHNNRYRELTDKSHASVGDLVINQFKKELQDPTKSEGFAEIVQVQFDIDRTGLQELYYQFIT